MERTIHTSQSISTSYRADIDGLRAIAVLGVIIWHAGLSAQGLLLLPGGFLGVDVFFVISGFLMARIWHCGITISEFAKRRLRRILPMLLVTILACVPFAMWLMGRSAQVDFGQDAIASALLVPNIFYSLQDSYWAAPGKLRPLLHLWTIGVEMQFYLLCPLIFLILKNWMKPILGLSLISALSFIGAIWLSRTHPDFAFYNLPTRIWEFGLGALVFYMPTKNLKLPLLPIIGLGLIVGSFLFLTETMRHPAWLTAIPVIGSCFIIAKGSTKTPILTAPLLRRIGLISFSAYLIHQPLFAFTRMSTKTLELTAASATGLILLTLILSEIAYRLIETPLRKAGCIKGLIIAALGVVALIGGTYLQQSDQTAAYNGEALSIKPERWILNAAGTRCVNKEIGHPCRLGNSKIDPTIALLGDSHMQAMGGGFDELFITNNLNDIDYSMGGCPFIMGVRRYARKYPCDEFVEEVFTQLTELEIKTVIILDRRNAYLLGDGAVFNDDTKEPGDLRLYPVSLGPDANPEQIQQEVERLHIATIKRLREMDIRIIMIYPVPEIGIHVPDALAERVKLDGLPLTLNRQLHEARQAPIGPLKTLSQKDKHILEIDPAEVFCNNEICETHSNADIYYTDRDHLSRTGTELLLAETKNSIINFAKSTQ